MIRRKGQEAMARGSKQHGSDSISLVEQALATNRDLRSAAARYTAAREFAARVNVGIRRRLAPLMENDPAKIQLMNSLLFSMPGSPTVYYGTLNGLRQTQGSGVLAPKAAFSARCAEKAAASCCCSR